MSLEANGKLQLGRYAFHGHASLDATHLKFAGDTHFALPLADLRAVQIDDDDALLLTHASGETVLTLEPPSLGRRWMGQLQAAIAAR